MSAVMTSGNPPPAVQRPHIDVPELRFTSVSEKSEVSETEKSRSTRRSSALKEILEMKEPDGSMQTKLQRKRTSRTSAMEIPPTEISERFPTLNDDDAQLVQISAVTKLVTEGVTEPEELSSVDVEFSLVDADGVHLFDSHPSLLQKRGQSHLGDARSSSLRLTFEAHGHRVDLTFQKQRAPISRNATLTLGTASGMQQFHMRDRHVYVHPQAVLTSVASTVTGVLRNGEAFLDFELQKGHRLLTVRLAQKDSQASIPQTIRKPLTLPERWTDCYEDDTETHALGMGIAVGSKLFSRFSDKDEAIDYVVQIVASSNLVYRPQLNFVLVVRKLHLQESHWQAPKWDQGPECPMQMAEQLHAFDKWDPPGSDRLETEGQGLWTLLDDCYVSGTIGLAYVGTLCQMEKNYWGQRSNTGVVWHSFRTWITFAHEVGHNFGGSEDTMLRMQSSKSDKLTPLSPGSVQVVSPTMSEAAGFNQLLDRLELLTRDLRGEMRTVSSRLQNVEVAQRRMFERIDFIARRQDEGAGRTLGMSSQATDVTNGVSYICEAALRALG